MIAHQALSWWFTPRPVLSVEHFLMRPPGHGYCPIVACRLMSADWYLVPDGGLIDTRFLLKCLDMYQACRALELRVPVNENEGCGQGSHGGVHELPNFM